MLNDKHTKLKKTLAITVAALQIPLLMLWKITVNAVRASCCALVANTKPNGDIAYELVFQWEKFGSVFPSYLPIFVALAACLILSVVGLVSVLRKKRVTIPSVCVYAVAVLSCGFLWFAFARPSTIVGHMNGSNLELQEFMFYRYFCGLEWRFNVDYFPLLEAIKFIFLGLHIAGSGVLCGLGIADFVKKRRRQFNV